MNLKLLAIDTTSNVATAAVVEETKCLGEITLNHSKTHSQKMMPIIESLLNELALDIKELDGIAVSAGPGSFTGVRIGMATAKALGHAQNLPVYPVSALEGLAYNVPAFDGLICPIMDARRDQVYTAIFKIENQKMVRILEDSPLSINELLMELDKNNEKVLFLGDGIVRFKDTIINHIGDRSVFASPHLRMQRASSVGFLVLEKIDEFENPSYLNAVPDYLRKSQAEREYDEKSKAK